MKKKLNMTKCKTFYTRDIDGNRCKFGTEVVIGNKKYFYQNDGKKKMVYEITEDMTELLNRLGE